jgi:hypothetical protein
VASLLPCRFNRPPGRQAKFSDHKITTYLLLKLLLWRGVE